MALAMKLISRRGKRVRRMGLPTMMAWRIRLIVFGGSEGNVRVRVVSKVKT